MISANKSKLYWWLLFASLVGLFSSSKLTLEKISFWEQKANGTSPVLGCDLNPIVGCGPVINSPPASIFGSLPNPIIGVIAFSALLLLSVLLLSGIKLAKWHWIGLQVGVVFGLAVVSYLQYESIYQLRALCPYCMLVWAIMIPTFWLVTARNLKEWCAPKRWAAGIYEWTALWLSLHLLGLLTLIWLQFGSTLWA